jgi:hydrogenase maturation protein HypF
MEADSNVKIINGKRFFLKSAEKDIIFSEASVNLLALGAEMSSTFCTVKDKKTHISGHIGEISRLEDFELFKKKVKDILDNDLLKPVMIACDLHPSYNSSTLAEELSKEYNTRLIKIQHHKAHVASVAGEHGIKDYVGIAMDGLGFGEDGKIWGGEVFDVTDATNFERIGHLEEQIQIGGDSATINPKKMLFGIVSKFLDKNELINLKIFETEETMFYLKQIEEDYNTIMTTSTGRILDSVSALLGICEKRNYDGEPAILLEKAAFDKKPYPLMPIIKKEKNKMILMTTPLFQFLLQNIHKDKGRLAATAQMYITEGIYQIADELAKRKNKKIVFSGGVAYNEMISTFMMEHGVLFNKEIPCGDGGISFGQAYLANAIILKKNQKR